MKQHELGVCSRVGGGFDSFGSVRVGFQACYGGEGKCGFEANDGETSLIQDPLLLSDQHLTLNVHSRLSLIWKMII
jgi:hypothetical protein